MTLTTKAWEDGGRIPAKHAQPGRDVSPALSWSAAPEGTASFVLMVHDVDAATGNGIDDVLHWMVWNLPGDDDVVARRNRRTADSARMDRGRSA